VEEVFDPIRFKKHQPLFIEKSKPLGVYYIKSGRVKVFKTGMDGKEQIVRIARAGELVGYKELMLDTRYTNSASVLETTEAYLIPKEDFQEVLNQNQQVAQAFNNMLCRDLMEAEQKLVDIAYKPVRNRLAEALVALSSVKSPQEDDLNIKLTREDLGRMIGTVKETVIRVLADFREEKLIATNGRNISILNLDRLTTIARFSM